MGRDTVMTPGDDSFQNEMIRAAGGIPPHLGRKGAVTPITREEWIQFNPQIIYGCGGDRKTAEAFFDRPGWKDVDAVKNGRIFYFPCELTCRAATHTGNFVGWLSAVIYADQFSKKASQVRDAEILRSRKLHIDLPYVKDARITYSTINDFLNKSLVIDFTKPLTIVSTLEGERSGIQTVGNHYEQGTINIILLSNMKLSPRAMTRAIISATEAKTAALKGLDVRSTPSPRRYQATGTGTDNILAVQGTGIPIEKSGGHSKMGELIAGAVYQGVLEAISKQNALVPDRNIFQRLADRHITLYELVCEAQCDCAEDSSRSTSSPSA